MQSAPGGRPYAPSWIDWLTAAIDRLPGPWWVPYLIAFAILVIAGNTAAFLDGSMRPASLDVYLTSLGVYPIAALGAIHYLDRKAWTAFNQMLPALSMDDATVETTRYRLTTMPASQALLWTVVGLAAALIYIYFGLSIPVRLAGPLARAFDIAMALAGFPLLTVLLFHTVRQLRRISEIQVQIRRIDLFQLRPVYAFSGVTARTGLIILGLAYVSAATDPTTFVVANPTLLAFVVTAIVAAIAAFVVPLLGPHERIAQEKARHEAEANRDLEQVLAEVGRRARAGDLSDADAVNKQLDSAVTRRDVVARVSTWPWEPATLRGFTTAVLLPIVLWVVFRALERLFQ